MYNRLEFEDLEVNGAEIVFKENPEEYEDQEEIYMDDLNEAPSKFKDTKLEVTNPLDKINLSTLKELRIIYISSLL